VFMNQDASPQRYEYVATSVRTQIADGTYSVGSELPTITALAAQFGVSHMTIKRALAVLVDEGLIATRRGARTRVLGLPNATPIPLLQQISELRDRVGGLDDRVAALESHAAKRTPRRST